MKWLRGYVICISHRGSWERFMNMCRHHRINLWKIQREEEVCFSLSARDFKKIQPMVRKTGICPHIKQKKGLPFFLWQMKTNWTFYSGFLLFLVLLSVLSSFVWEIQFRGQCTYTKETLLKTVNSMQIHRGMKRSRLVCDDIEKNIREVYPDISWVSAEEKGSLLVISIKEAEKEIEREKGGRPCHLVADYDGVVKKISVNRGIALVKPGQRVKKGQVLISGVLPITGDDDTVVEKVPVVAKGEVELYVEQNISKEIPVQLQEKKYTGRTLKKYEYEMNNCSICIKNPIKRFNKSCKYDIITTVFAEKRLQPFNFFVKKRTYDYREYRWSTKKRTKTEIGQVGEKIYQSYLRKLKEAEFELVTHTAKIRNTGTGIWKLEGHIGFLCRHCTKKYIAENELQVEEKTDGGENGES